MNTPINDLIKEYEMEFDGYDYSDITKVIVAAQRYVRTMEDSQVRCLLYILAQHAEDQLTLKDKGHALKKTDMWYQVKGQRMARTAITGDVPLSELRLFARTKLGMTESQLKAFNDGVDQAINGETAL